jgi:hypothetical protein
MSELLVGPEYAAPCGDEEEQHEERQGAPALLDSGDLLRTGVRLSFQIDRIGAGVCCVALLGAMLAVNLALRPAGGDPGAMGDGRTATVPARWPSDWLSVSGQTVTSDGQRIHTLEAGTRSCRGRRGAVTTTNFEATQAGLQVLAAGGNAADAAVAVQLMLGVTQPESTGIGGGSFIMYFDAESQEVVAIDGREEAPARFHPRIFCANATCGEDPSCLSCPAGPLDFRERYTGGLAVGVPGTLAAAGKLLAEFGTRPMADVVGPAIQRARSGVT